MKRESLHEWAEEEGVSVTSLLGYLLYLENWNIDKSLADVGWKIFLKEDVKIVPSVTVEEAIWLLEKSQMSQAVYLEIRLRFKGRIYLPPVMKIRAENKVHRPHLEEYRNGVKASLMDCLSLTLSERLKFLDLSGLDKDTLELSFKMGWGLDGSGEHSDYQQLSKVSYTTKQVMSICFALREVKVTDHEGQSASWSSCVAGTNKPQNTRPLALFPSKETPEMLAEFVPRVEAEVKLVKEQGVQLKSEDGSNQCIARCKDAQMSMCDGKMVVNLLNCGGAFCIRDLYSSLFWYLDL